MATCRLLHSLDPKSSHQRRSNSHNDQDQQHNDNFNAEKHYQHKKTITISHDDLLKKHKPITRSVKKQFTKPHSDAFNALFAKKDDVNKKKSTYQSNYSEYKEKTKDAMNYLPRSNLHKLIGSYSQVTFLPAKRLQHQQRHNNNSTSIQQQHQQHKHSKQFKVNIITPHDDDQKQQQQQHQSDDSEDDERNNNDASIAQDCHTIASLQPVRFSRQSKCQQSSEICTSQRISHIPYRIIHCTSADRLYSPLNLMTIPFDDDDDERFTKHNNDNNNNTQHWQTSSGTKHELILELKYEILIGFVRISNRSTSSIQIYTSAQSAIQDRKRAKQSHLIDELDILQQQQQTSNHTPQLNPASINYSQFTLLSSFRNSDCSVPHNKVVNYACGFIPCRSVLIRCLKGTPISLNSVSILGVPTHDCNSFQSGSHSSEPSSSKIAPSHQPEQSSSNSSMKHRNKSNQFSQNHSSYKSKHEASNRSHAASQPCPLSIRAKFGQEVYDLLYTHPMRLFLPTIEPQLSFAESRNRFPLKQYLTETEGLERDRRDDQDLWHMRR
jgi:hypothetical protein